MDFQQPHRYMRPPLPPPPSVADPHHQPPPRQPVPPQGSWFSSGQFHYHQPSQHSPSPPPPHHQWAPPPHSDHHHLPPYPAPHHPPYPPHPLHNQYSLPPLPRPPPPQPPPHHPHSQIPQPFHQDWANPNWGHHQGRDYPVHNNEEDWAAKARAWAASKAATEHPQLQFTPVGRPEEQSHYHDQYPQTIDPYYADVLQPSLPASSYHQYPSAPAPLHGVHPLESASVISAQSSYVPDGHLSFTARDGILAGDSNAAFPYEESSSTSPLVRQQEVSSSYSSVTGKEEAEVQNGKFYKSFPIASTQGQHLSLHPLPAVGRSALMEQTHYAFGNHFAEPTTDLSDQPLDFAPRFNRDHDPHMQPNYTHNDSGGAVRGVDPTAAVSSIHTWAPPVAPGVVYPPIPQVLPSGPQHDPSGGLPSPIPAHSASMFGRMPGPNFQPTIPSVGASFGIGTGTAILPATAFPGDVYGVSSVPEHPKKASVPNWLREEIIKKAAIASSAPEHPKEGTHSIEDEDVGSSLGKGDQAESKSIDSSRSTEEEDDDEDYVEAARTAAINQEIKRVLTEVLLKVTDELFDEIATKVLREDDLTVEVVVDPNAVTSNHKVSPSTPAVPTSKASAKVLISAKDKETDTENVGGKSTSSSPGDVLGLASYASDDDEENDIQSSGVPNSEENTVHQQPSIRRLSEEIHMVENDISQVEGAEHRKSYTNVEGNPSSWNADRSTSYRSVVIDELSNNLAARESPHDNVRSRYSSKMESGVVEDDTNADGKKILNGLDAFKSKESVGDKRVKTEVPVESAHANKSMTDNSHGRETRNKPDKNDGQETNRSSTSKNLVKGVESGKNGTDEKGDGSRKRQDEKHRRKESTDDLNGLKERMKEQGVKSGEKVKESDSRKKSSHPDVKGDRKEAERDRGVGAREDSSRRKERAKDEKGERSRHKLTGESSRHKRRRSSSVGSRGRNSKDNSVVSHASDSSDEASDDSKRKLHSRKRNLSPSPPKSRRRQVSRSPHSKHYHSRHSPYSSLESTRGRKSRSRSPVRRQR